MRRQWNGVIALENVQTGDGRVIATGALEWPDLPLPLAWLDDGDQHVYTDSAPVIGTIETIERAGDEIRATGFIDDLDDPMSAPGRAIAMMDAGSAPFGNRFGVSIDGDNWEVEVVATQATEDEPGDIVVVAAAQQSIAASWPRARLVAAAGDPDPGEGGGADGATLYADSVDDVIERATRLRIRGATLCAVPAFSGCYIEMTDAAPAVAPVVAHAAGQPAAPPDEWFSDPCLEQLERWTTITDEGRVYGHLAGWGEWYIGVGVRITPDILSGGGYDYATPAHVVTASGRRIGTMPMAVKGGHYSTTGDAAGNWRGAQAHYDDPSTAVCDVMVGEDRYGIWFAGALRPDASPENVYAMRASGVSGDWRMIGNQWRLVGACAVNTPGFPKVHVAMAASGHPLALVAAGGHPLPAPSAHELRLERRIAALESSLHDVAVTELRKRV